MIAANAEALQLYGYSPADLIGKLESDLRAKRDCSLAQELEAITHQSVSGRIFPVKLRPLRFGGQSSKSEPYRLAIPQINPAEINRRIVKIGCMYQSLLEDQTEFISRFKVDGTFLYANEVYCRYFGKKLNDLIGKQWQPVVHPADIPAIEAKLHTLSPSTPTVMVENRVITAGGETRWAQFTNRAFFDAKGQLSEIQSVGRDITERKQMEETLHLSEQRFRALFNDTYQWTSLLQPDGRVLEMNETALTSVGVTRQEVVGKYFWETVWWKTDTGLQEQLKKALKRAAGGEFVRYNVEILGGKGQTILLDFSIKPIMDSTGRVTYLISEGRDITMNHLQADEQVKAAKLESLGVLAGGIAHDLNNIMMCISLSLELIRIQARRGTVGEEHIEESLQNVKRASGLSKRLLTFAHGGDPVMSLLDMGELVTNAVSMALHGSSLQPHLHVAPDLPAVLGDSGQLNQVIDSLVINAREAEPPGTKLDVRVEAVTVAAGEHPYLEPGPYIKLVIADNGPGIPPEIINRIFDPYFTTKKAGSGLGLTSSFSIVRRHGGTIWARSNPGQGATLNILLPCAAQEKSAGEKKSDTVPVKTNRNWRVLIVDDDSAVRKTVGQTLRLSGFSVVETDKGEAGFAQYRKAMREGEPYDAVLLDATIQGGLGGAEALELFRRADPHVRAILMSGYSHTGVVTKWQESGFRALLRKPFTCETMVQTLNQVCAVPAA